MDQKIKIESFESDRLAELKDEPFIKIENFYEPKLEINESALLEDPLNVLSDAQEPFSYEIKAEIKSEINDVSENCSEIVIKTEQDSLNINPTAIIPGLDKTFQCDQCNKQYYHKSHLNRHIASVHDRKKSECDQCEKQFYYKTNLNRHISAVHQGTVLKVIHKRKNKDFNVLQKAKRNKSKKSLLKTKPSYYVENDIKGKLGSFKFESKEHGIEKSTGSSNCSTAVHEDSIPKPYQCQICDFKFRYPSLLNRHIRSVHEGKRPFHCNICISAFYEKTKLKEHIEAVHEGTIPKPYQCQMCDSKFRFPSLLNRHTAQIHNGKKGDK